MARIFSIIAKALIKVLIVIIMVANLFCHHSLQKIQRKTQRLIIAILTILLILILIIPIKIRMLTLTQTQRHTTEIDIFCTDNQGFNGLHLAVASDIVPTVQCLLEKVYINDDLRHRILDSNTARIATGISTRDGLSLFELLLKYCCAININPMMEQTISYSSLILELMSNKQLFSALYLTESLIQFIIEYASCMTVHGNIEIIRKHISGIKSKVSIKDYQSGVMSVLFNIMMNDTFDGYFGLFKQLIVIFLDLQLSLQNDQSSSLTLTNIPSNNSISNAYGLSEAKEESQKETEDKDDEKDEETDTELEQKQKKRKRT